MRTPMHARDLSVRAVIGMQSDLGVQNVCESATPQWRYWQQRLANTVVQWDDAYALDIFMENNHAEAETTFSWAPTVAMRNTSALSTSVGFFKEQLLACAP